MANIGVEGDLREQNRNNAVLFIGNFLGGLYGILAATLVILLVYSIAETYLRCIASPHCVNSA